MRLLNKIWTFFKKLIKWRTNSVGIKIFVLESLRKTDRKTGWEIYKYLQSKKANTEFYPFKSKDELFNILKLIEIDVVANKEQPFVHFDCHGSDSGITIVKQDGSEESVSWKEIRDKFCSIYVASGKKSIICMSSCKGFNAVKMVAHYEPCPYDHVCGSFEKITFKDSYIGYRLFYKLILSGISLYDAAVKVHNNPDLKAMKFIGLNSNTLFNIAIEGYIAKECTEDALRQRKEEAIRNILTVNGELTQVQKDYLDEAYSLEGQQVIIDSFAQKFFSLP